MPDAIAASPVAPAAPAAKTVVPSPRPGTVSRDAPKPPEAAPPAEAASADKSKEDFLKPRFDELAKQTKQLAAQRRALSEEKATIAKEKAEYEAWKATREDRRRNPQKYMQEDFGENWYDTLTQVKMSGAPTPDLIASELAEQEKRLLRRVEEKEKALRDEMESHRKSEEEREKQSYLTGAVEYTKQNAKDFYWVNELGEHQAVAAEIERHFLATTRQLPDGSHEAGELLTAAQAAKVVEDRIEAVIKRVEEAKAKREAATKPAAPAAPKRNETPQRRSLSTDMTSGGTGEWTPPKDDGERLRRAIGAWERRQAENQH